MKKEFGTKYNNNELVDGKVIIVFHDSFLP